MSDQLNALHESIVSVCAINGVSSDGAIDFKPEATQEQRAAAQAIMSDYLANPGEWEPTFSAEDVAEQAMRKCEEHFDANGFTGYRVQDLLVDLLDESVSAERKSRILQIKAWLRTCRDVTLSNPAGVVGGRVLLPSAPLKYKEV